MISTIYYADGSTANYPGDIPLTNVVKIVQNGEVVSHAEYYVFKFGKWRNVYCSCIAKKYSDEGLTVLEGIWVDDETFKEIMN